jgi:hypothetical protein
MKIALWILAVTVAGLICGCSNFACKTDITLGMDEQDALQRIPGIRLVAEEMNRKEYACQLFEDCPITSWFRASNPYKLSFSNSRLLRMEINQDELTRQEMNRAVDMRYNFHRW